MGSTSELTDQGLVSIVQHGENNTCDCRSCNHGTGLWTAQQTGLLCELSSSAYLSTDFGDGKWTIVRKSSPFSSTKSCKLFHSHYRTEVLATCWACKDSMPDHGHLRRARTELLPRNNSVKSQIEMKQASTDYLYRTTRQVLRTT